jgi:putative hydrolase of the HAD superfamily
MKKNKQISTLFLDIGGVLLTNGWDMNMRKRAAEKFHLDFEELEERHQMVFDPYEQGRLSIDEYLKLVVFHKKRVFDFNDFKNFLFAQTRPLPDMIKMFKSISENNSLKIGAISNEGRELTIYRVNHFRLKEIVQFFICSCFVHFRKPDKDIFRMALDVAQAIPEQSLYVDDRELHIEVARSLGMNAIRHVDINVTRKELSDYRLE